MIERSRRDEIQNVVLAEALATVDLNEAELALTHNPVDRLRGDGEVFGHGFFREEVGHWNNDSSGIPVCFQMRIAVFGENERFPRR